MFNIKRLCISPGEEGPHYYSTIQSDAVRNSWNIGMWSLSPRLISIKEALDKGILLNEVDGRTGNTQSEVSITLSSSGIPEDDLIRHLFRILEPADSSLLSRPNTFRFILVKSKEELEKMADIAWKEMNAFSSTANLTLALRGLAKNMVDPNIKGDFRRIVKALKMLLNQEEVRIRGTKELSSYMDKLCCQISSGDRKVPEVSKEMRNAILRLHSSYDGEPTPVCLISQISRSTIPIKALGNGQIGEETICYLPRDYLGKAPRYKTVCLTTADTSMKTRSQIICRILPNSHGGTTLSLTPGRSSKSKGCKIMTLEEAENILRGANIDFTKESKPIDGTNRNSYYDRLLIDVDRLSIQKCYNFTVEAVNPEIVQSPRSAAIPVPKSIKDTTKPIQFLETTTSSPVHLRPVNLSLEDMDKYAPSFGTDISFIKNRALKVESLGEKMWEAYKVAREVLPELIGKFYKKGIALIEKQAGREMAADAITREGHRLICCYETKTIQNWDGHTSHYEKAINYFINERVGRERVPVISTQMIESTQMLCLCDNKTKPMHSTDIEGLPISPMLVVIALMIDILIDNKVLARTKCDCKNTSYNSCQLTSHIASCILKSFIFEKTVGGIYFRWWEEGKKTLDMETFMRESFSSQGNANTLDNRIALIVPKGAIRRDIPCNIFCC